MDERPMMSSFDELEANLGSESDATEASEFKPFFMSRLEIAYEAYNAAQSMDGLVCIHDHDQLSWMKDWEDLSEDEQSEYADIVLLALKMQKESEEDFGRLVHGKRAMQYLLKGYRFAEIHDDAQEQTHLVAPWDSLPNERKAPLMIFKGVVKALFKVWDNDNPMLARH